NLAKVTEAGLLLKSLEGKFSGQNVQITSNRIALSWMPFRAEGDSLIDPFSGFTLSRSLLG
ncbi:MAG: hypothetical protein HYR80_09050, partial [Nitrospirae bacterium]|nr:hypothetical protein [Nitrospirota bacterium]